MCTEAATVLGDPASSRPLTTALALKSGARVVSVDYGLAPEHPFPAAVTDAAAAYRGLLAQGRTGKEVAVGGESAGGGLAVAILIAARDEGLALPACAFAISPWTDLSCAAASFDANAKLDPMLTRRALKEMADAYLAGASAWKPLASPLFGDLRGLPPLLIHVGSDEVLLDDSRLLHLLCAGGGHSQQAARLRRHDPCLAHVPSDAAGRRRGDRRDRGGPRLAVEALMGRLSGKRALVTGAASGIGRACALAMAHEGAELILTDIDEAGGCETLAMIAASGRRVRFHLHDVASEEAWKGVLAELDVLHVLVNNAGQCIAAPLAETSYDVWRRQLAVNLDGVFFGTKLAMPLLARSGAGSIVNVSSVAGLKGIAGLSGYCASKGAVRLFSKAVALECAQSGNGVRVNSIHPGAIETPIWAKMGHGGSPPADARRYREAMDAARAASVAATPLGRAGTADDIAAGVVFLSSDEARFITGTELVIDGGVMAG